MILQLEKEQTKLEVRRKKIIMKQTKTTTEKINEAKNWFFEKKQN